MTVSNLCRRSGLNRGTFYLHYSDVSDLAIDVARTLVQDISGPWQLSMADAPGDFADRSVEFLTAYFTHAAEHRTLYQWMLGPHGGWSVIRAILEEYADAIGRGLEHLDQSAQQSRSDEWTTSIIAGALFGALAHWVNASTTSEPRTVATWLWGELTVHPVAPSPR